MDFGNYESLVNYPVLDQLKIYAQRHGSATEANINSHIGACLPWSRGESVFLLEQNQQVVGITVEGLGTKNLIALEAAFEDLDQEKLAHNCFAKDCVAMIANDMVSCGIMPGIIGMYLAIGSNDLLENKSFCQGLLDGWTQACNEIGAVYGSGDTPILNELIKANSYCLSGAGIGFAQKDQLIKQEIAQNDRIILLSSSGIHANGLTSMRNLAKNLDNGYQTSIGDKTFLDWLLTPTFQYTEFVRDLIEAGVQIHGLANITGHGFRKIMRSDLNYQYVIDRIPYLNDFWTFVLDQGITLEEAYRTYNMGAGYALYLSADQLDNMAEVYAAKDRKFYWIDSGYVEPSVQKSVVLPSINVRFDGEEMKIR